MPLTRDLRLAAAAAAAGAALLGWSLGGVASVDDDLKAAATTPAPQPASFVQDDHRCHGGQGSRL